MSATQLALPTTLPTQQPPLDVPYLTLPKHTQLMPPPDGRPDAPLLGVTTLAVSPNYAAQPMLAAGTNGNGVLVSWIGGESWYWSTAGLPLTASVTSLVISSDEMTALVAPGAAYRSRDAGETWEPIPGLGEKVEQISYSPAYQNDGILFAVQRGALLRSADRGASWTTVLPSSGCPMNVALSPAFATDATAFAPRCDHVVRSSDGGLAWADVSNESGDLQVGDLMNLQVAPDYPESGRILAQGGVQGMPVLSDDGGRNWRRAYDHKKAPFVLGVLATVQFAPDSTLVAAGHKHLYDPRTSVWRSADDGQEWQVIARAAGLGGLVLSSGAAWLGTPDGIFFDTGAGWRFLHPGGSQQSLVELPSVGPVEGGEPVDVALARHGIDKYTTRIRLFEKPDGYWQLVFEHAANRSPRRAFPCPTYPEERLILLLGQDYGGGIWTMALRPETAETLTLLDDIPAGPGDSVDRYDVSYAEDYVASGRIELRHGHSGALYFSLDRGASWTRPDPAAPGGCQRSPVSGFGALWHENDAVRNRLLCPLEDEQPCIGTVQQFENGELLRLDPTPASPSGSQVLALLPTWEAWGTLPAYEAEVAIPDTPAGFFPPAPALQVAWVNGECCYPLHQPVREVLGWATGEASDTHAARQRFEGGTMIWRGDRDEILVLEQTAEGARYTVYPD